MVTKVKAGGGRIDASGFLKELRGKKKGVRVSEAFRISKIPFMEKGAISEDTTEEPIEPKVDPLQERLDRERRFRKTAGRSQEKLSRAFILGD